MKKLLILCGQTATGKTALALNLAQKFNGELISADSRQVYRGMDIGTGKDIPSEFSIKFSGKKFSEKKIIYYTNHRTKIWGYDLVNPNEEFSVAHFVSFANQILEDIWQRQRLPILVGGTGLYIKSLLSPPPTLNIKPNNLLRTKLSNVSIDELKRRLISKNQQKFESMNYADQQNPRRLIRAIEVAESTFHQKTYVKNLDTLLIGLKLSSNTLDKKINHRIKKRIEQGFDNEVRKLISDGLLVTESPAATAIGYREWSKYLKGEITQEEAIELWKTAENQYARRQMTWFEKQSGIVWFDPSKENTSSLVVKCIKNWYS